MIGLYGKTIQLNKSYTREHVIETIALKANSLPRFIEEYTPEQKTIRDFITECKEYGKTIPTDSEFDIPSYQEFFIQKDAARFTGLSEVEKIKTWLSYIFIEKRNDTIKFIVENELAGRVDLDIAEFIKNESDRYRTQVEAEAKQFSVVVNKKKEISSRLERSQPLPATQLSVNNIEYKIITSSSSSFLEFLNNIHLSETVPFATYNQIYKIYTELDLPGEWSLSTDTAIICKVKSSAKYGLKKVLSINDRYDDLLILKDNSTGMIEVRLNIKGSVDTSTRDRILQGVHTSLRLEGIIVSTQIISISGLCFIPGVQIDKFVFSDLILTNSILSEFLSTNEILKTTKEKNELNLYFRDKGSSEVDEIRFNLLNRVGEREDIEIRGSGISVGENFLRVNIKYAKNLEKIQYFLDKLGRMLTIYIEEEPEVAKYYKKYFPEFDLVKKTVTKKTKVKADKKEGDKVMLKYIAPELFPANYYRYCCDVSKSPTIITDQKQLRDWDGQVMTFPRSGKQYQFICDKNPEYPYPGIRKHELENKEIFPFLPCCYKKDQTKKPLYVQYFSGEDQKIEKGRQQHIIVTNKLVNFDNFGILPELLQKLFNSISPGIKYIRKGVLRGQSSLLDCVLEAVNPDVETLTQEARLKYLSDTRKEMTRYAYLAKQNMWDVSDYEIIGRLENLETYLDPRKWIMLIEKVFKINVYVFARDNDSEDVYLVVPDHKNGLYTNIKKYDKSVVIYEHYGNESDNAKYPQCEIVCRWDTNNQNIAIPHLSGNILDGYVDTVFRQTSHTSVDFPIEKHVKAQGIDYIGKTRYVEIDGIVFFTTPLYNLRCNKQISIPSTISRYRYGDVKSLCDKYGISIIGKSGDSSELNCRVGNVEMWVSITSTRLDVATYPIPQFKTLQKDVYSHNQSIARILIENAIYSYSCYIQKGDLDARDLKNVANFAKRYIQVDEKHEYPDKIDLSLSRSNSYMKDFIVKVKNLETAKRLVYHIRLVLESNLQRVIEMYKSSRITNFYRDIHDMDIRSQELVVKGDDMIKRLANTVTSNRVYTEIRFDINKYLCNIIEPKRIYQVIGSETTLEKLFKRVYDLDTVPEFILYACHSSTTTKKYHVIGDRYDQVYRVLGWRVSATEVRYAILKQD